MWDTFHTKSAHLKISMGDDSLQLIPNHCVNSKAISVKQCQAIFEKYGMVSKGSVLLEQVTFSSRKNKNKKLPLIQA